MFRSPRFVAFSLILALFTVTLWLPVASAARQRVTVRSNNFRYTRYDIAVRGRVELVNQISTASCNYGRSWGYDRNGIWVDNGCSAEFEVYDDYSGNNNGSRVSGKTAAIVAGAAGAAILAGVLIAKSRNNNKNKQPTTVSRNDDEDTGPKEKVPQWLVGTFANRAKQTEMGIYEDGTVVIKQGNRDRYYGNYYDGRIFYNGLKLKIAKDRDGFTATELNSRENDYFQRTK